MDVNFEPFRITPLDSNISIKNLKETSENIYNFTVVSSDLFSANKLRKIISSSIPSLALDELIFKQNSSNFCDEMISNIISQIPIYSGKNFYKLFKTLDLGLISNYKNFNKFVLNVSNHYYLGSRLILSDFLINLNNNEIQVISNDIPLVRLNYGQEIELEITTAIGCENFNIFKSNRYTSPKWNPVVSCIFKKMTDNYQDKVGEYELEIEIKGSVDVQDILKIALDIYQNEVKTKNKILYY